MRVYTLFWRLGAIVWQYVVFRNAPRSGISVLARCITKVPECCCGIKGVQAVRRSKSGGQSIHVLKSLSNKNRYIASSDLTSVLKTVAFIAAALMARFVLLPQRSVGVVEKLHLSVFTMTLSTMTVIS